MWIVRIAFGFMLFTGAFAQASPDESPPTKDRGADSGTTGPSNQPSDRQKKSAGQSSRNVQARDPNHPAIGPSTTQGLARDAIAGINSR